MKFGRFGRHLQKSPITTILGVGILLLSGLQVAQDPLILVEEERRDKWLFTIALGSGLVATPDPKKKPKEPSAGESEKE